MPASRYGEIAAHLDAHGKPGEVALDSHLPDFVQLVWQSPLFASVSWLDGHHPLYGDDSQVFDFWFALRELGSFTGGDVGELAVETLGARRMVVPAANDTPAALVQDSRQVQQALRTDDGWRFELRPRAAALGEARP